MIAAAPPTACVPDSLSGMFLAFPWPATIVIVALIAGAVAVLWAMLR